MADSINPNRTECQTTTDDTQTLSIPMNPNVDMRYTLGAEIARGGMGVVYSAHDEQFHREVAVKVLHAEHADLPTPIRRFIEESRISGQLQHPGIPPVFDLGTLPDGRPFLAMKLIKGQTFANLLQREKPELPALVQIFEQIAQTVAYAHSKRVVHRDLKPGNVMVGAFGEVQVMDWGLAKVLGDNRVSLPDEADCSTADSVIDTARADDSNTQAGSVLGTPAYMPPEQALGQIDNVDTRADVFSIGAILCDLLTGQPPYVGTFSQIVAYAAGAHLAPAMQRLDNCDEDDELVTLCKQCLAAEIEARPKDASIVAARIAEYQSNIEERLHLAEVEAARVAAKAEESRKRHNLWVTIGLICFIVSISAALLVWYDHDAYSRRQRNNKKRQEEQQRLNTHIIADAKQAYSEALTHRQRGLTQTDQLGTWLHSIQSANVQIIQANKLLSTIDHSTIQNALENELHKKINNLSNEIDNDLEMCNLFIEIGAIRDDNDERLLSGMPMDRRTAGKYYQAFKNAGCDVRIMSVEEIQFWLDEHHEYRNQLLAGLLSWTMAIPYDDRIRFQSIGKDTIHTNDKNLTQLQYLELSNAKIYQKLVPIRESAIQDPLMQQWLDVVKLGQDKQMAAMMDNPALLRRSSQELQLLIEVLTSPAFTEHVWNGREDYNRKLVHFLRKVHRRFPAHYWINLELGKRLVEFDRPIRDRDPENVQESLRFFTAAAALRPDSAIPLIAMARTINTVEQARELLERAIEVDPTSSTAHGFHGAILESEGHFRQAQQELATAIQINPNIGYFWLQNIVYQDRQSDAETVAIRRTSEQWDRLFQALIDVNPKHPSGYFIRGQYAASNKQYDKAIANYQDALHYSDSAESALNSKTTVESAVSIAMIAQQIPYAIQYQFQNVLRRLSPRPVPDHISLVE